jgi:hypothetical protein
MGVYPSTGSGSPYLAMRDTRQSILYVGEYQSKRTRLPSFLAVVVLVQRIVAVYSRAQPTYNTQNASLCCVIYLSHSAIDIQHLYPESVSRCR